MNNEAAKRCISVLAAALAVSLAAASSYAGQRYKPATEQGWEVVEKDGRAAVYCACEEEDGTKAQCLKSDSASFSIQRAIDVDVKNTPYLKWRWKAVKLPEGGDFRDEDKDDQAAQLFVAFDGGDSISYIWDTTAPVGATGGQWIPWVMEVKIMVVESGAKNLGRWMSVTRNVYEDYKKLYGGEPPRAEGLRFQINSQYTGTKAESCLDYVEFSETP